ncbi:MAG: class I tRNA ligase family protein [Patescibacteria group bacterium]
MSKYDELPKAYDASAVEKTIFKTWEDSGFFNPDRLPKRNLEGEPYCIVLPPPNRTGILHLGHAKMLAIEDLLIRFQRMAGKKAYWVPGTDHAAISTQIKVEQELIKQGMKDPRRELGREKFLEKVREFAEQSRSTIINQCKAMGSSMDWAREKYTLDAERNRAVNKVFEMMWQDGLIERGYRVVNWDPQFQTTLSDDEVEHKETQAELVTFKYDKNFPIPISTTRPETKFGDTAVAVHPEDERYKKYVGQEYAADFCGKPIKVKVIADASVDQNFGTGALGVTPAHSLTDADLAEKHDLRYEQVIGTDGRMTEGAGPGFAGLTVQEARKKIIVELEAKGDLIKQESVAQNLLVAQRGGTPVEQLPMRQWFVRVNNKFTLRQDTLGKWKKGEQATLKELMRFAVESKQTRIMPENFEKIYFHWIDNLRDWCISRQIWFGHQIPVWYNGEDTKVGNDSPGEGWERDPDTLDTWFSSGLWTFSTLGWPGGKIKITASRHATTHLHGGGRFIGQEKETDADLNEKGKEQAEELAKKLKDEKFDVIITSPSRRCRLTAEIVNKFHDVEIIEDQRLHEYSFGFMNGKTREELLKDHPDLPVWKSVGIDSRYKDEETPKEVKTRVGSFINDLKQKYIGKHVYVVTSSGVLDFFDLLLNKKTFNEIKVTTHEKAGIERFTIVTDEDLKVYHPTAVLETGYDILFFWVARMILMSTYVLGEVPFKDVYLHGLVRDEQGRKMSKSLGNALDPLELIPKYGTDAVRLSLVMGTSPGMDQKLSEEKIKDFRNFTNKLWNISRFVLQSTADVSKDEADEQWAAPKTLADRWILARFYEVQNRVTKLVAGYQFSQAGELLRDFTWGEFADWYLEISKIEKNKAAILLHILNRLLKLWHPFMPFVTEYIWGLEDFDELLLVAEWPQGEYAEQAAVRDFELIKNLIVDIRRLRSEQGVEAAAFVEACLVGAHGHAPIQENAAIIKQLARLSNLKFSDAIPEGWATALSGSLSVGIDVAGTVDKEKEAAKTQKDIAALKPYIETTRAKLADTEFTSKAPAKVVASMQSKLDEAEAKLKVLEGR